MCSSGHRGTAASLAGLISRFLGFRGSKCRMTYTISALAVLGQATVSAPSDPDGQVFPVGSLGVGTTGLPQHRRRQDLTIPDSPSIPASSPSRTQEAASSMFRRSLYVAETPPSTRRARPLSIAPASLRTKQTTEAMSSHSANLPSGMRASIGPPLLGSLHARLPISVITTVGFTELTRIP